MVLKELWNGNDDPGLLRSPPACAKDEGPVPDGRADKRWMGENYIEYGQVAHRADGRSADGRVERCGHAQALDAV